MSLIDKQMLLRDLSDRLGAFIPANDLQKILAEADEALVDYEVTSAPTGGGPDGNSEDLLRYYLEAKRIEGKSEKTIAHYEYILRRLLNDTQVPFAKMTVYHIRNYYTSERERGIKSSTLEGYRQTYSSFFGWLSREDLIKKNPMNNLTAIKQPKVVRKPFSPVEIAMLSEAAKSIRNRALLAFLLSTGCRVSEVCSVMQTDIDWQNLQLTVTGKGNKQRTVYIDDVTSMLLKRYLDTRTDDSPVLFLSSRGLKALTPSGIQRMLKDLEKISGVENVHPHRFRRTLATSLINKGMPIQEVAAILGHDKIDTTMTYVYIDATSLANAYKKYA